jgi:DNA-binding NarL/FixJ family response regulator
VIRVLLADDQELVRAGLRMILEAQDDIIVVAEVADGPSAVRETLQEKPDVALLDIQMPGGNGLAAARQILGNPGLSTRVIVLTTFDLDEYVVEALSAGASGFLLKSTPRANLLHAVRTAVRGESLLDPALTARLVESYARRSGDTSLRGQVDALSPREKDVFTLLAQGRSNAEIASRLFLAETTIKSHVAAVLRKLGLRDRLQAVIYGYESGLVQPGALDPEAGGQTP